MTDNQKQAAHQKLARAHETLHEAKTLFQARHFIGTVNRAYYACFYAVTALLATQDLYSSKHSGVQSLFNRHFVKTGIIKPDWGRFYSDLFKLRHEGDYTDFPKFTEAEVLQLCDASENFLAELSAIVNRLG